MQSKSLFFCKNPLNDTFLMGKSDAEGGGGVVLNW